MMSSVSCIHIMDGNAVMLLFGFHSERMNMQNICPFILSAENRKGIIAVQQCSLDTQKGANAIDFVQQ